MKPGEIFAAEVKVVKIRRGEATVVVIDGKRYILETKNQFKGGASMTLSIILWTAALAIFFGITNAVSYTRGNNSGYTDGLLDGAKAKIRELTDGKFELDCRGDDGDE